MPSETAQKRTYDSSLRAKQQELTRQSIMAAAQELILEGRLHNFTIHEIAARAGVSQRTVYLHFGSREAILEGLVHWVVQRATDRTPPIPERLDDLPAWAETAIPELISFLPAAKAMYAVLQAVYDRQPPAPSRERDRAFARLIEKAAPDLPAPEQRAATAALRLWGSLRTWIELQSRYGLTAEELALAVKQGMQAQIEQLRRRAAEAGRGKR